MKSFLAVIALFACVTVTSAQTNPTVDQLKKVYMENVSWPDAGELSYDAGERLLSVKNYRIPVSKNTLVRTDKNSVHFAMQQGTAVTDANDPSWRRAEFIIPFSDKKSAAEFVKRFNELITED
jgi:hypothetical protein